MVYLFSVLNFLYFRVHQRGQAVVKYRGRTLLWVHVSINILFIAVFLDVLVFKAMGPSWQWCQCEGLLIHFFGFHFRQSRLAFGHMEVILCRPNFRQTNLLYRLVIGFSVAEAFIGVPSMDT